MRLFAGSPRIRRFFAIIAALGSTGSLAAAAPPLAERLAPPVEVAQPSPEPWQDEVAPAVLQELAVEGEADFFVDFGARADLSGAKEITDWQARGDYVVERLQATAEASQRQTIELLEQAGVRYRPFWIVNTILVEDGTEQLAERLATQPAVTGLSEVGEYEVPELLPAEQEVAAEQVEWGIAAIRADQAWDRFGVRGDGIVIGSIDTGVQYNHPDLVDRYRGNTGDGFDHNYNWYDPSSICPTDEPCDNQGHGTHTTGTMVGGSASGFGIGVAPEAQWIAAKGCEAVGQVGCTVDALLASGEWMLAPTDLAGENPRTDLRPHIINNSWGAHNGSFVDTYYDHIISAWNAAGIFTVFSAGNDGARGCNTIASPADSPHAYAVGAHDIDNTIAEFSSRGPSAGVDVRPNIAAPGVAIRSSIPGGYGLGNGTSMAAPHVAGTVALMWSAAPSLVGDVAGTRELLDQTAVDTEDLSCGGTAARNNVFGEGRLDAHAAVLASPIGPTGVLTGVVTDADTGAPVPNATVEATGPDYRRRTSTDADGRYEISLVAGEYQLTAVAYGYEQATVTGVIVTEGETTTSDIPVVALPSVTVSGTVTDGSGHGWPLYAGITIAGYPHGTIYTDPTTGRYQVTLPADTTYHLTVTSHYDGYDRLSTELVVGDSDLVADLALTASTDECLAPGYRSAHLGLYEAFDTGEPPAGWTLETTVGDGWQFNDPGQRTNLTGGEGRFASIDSAHGALFEDGLLISGPVDLTDAADPLLSFRSDVLLTRGVAEVDISIDGGESWDNVWRQTSLRRGPRLEQVSLPAAAGKPDVRVRFHYRNDVSYNGWWQVDEVLLGERSCAPVPGGLVIGRVTDDRTGEPVIGATVASVSQPELRTTTVDTPDDRALGGGFYWLFSPATGEQELTAEHVVGQYAAGSATANVVGSGVARADFALSTGELAVSTRTIEANPELGQRQVTTVTLTNVGTAPAKYQLTERNDEFALRPAQRELLAQPGAPLQLLPVAGEDAEASSESTGDPAASPDPTEVDWIQLHDARWETENTLGAVHDGKLYVIGGSSGTLQRNLVYDIAEDRWDMTSFMPVRNLPAGDFLGDLLYVVGGYGPSGVGAMATNLVYDPATDSWSTAADAPYPVAVAGHAVLDGKLYVIAGRTGADGETALASVAVYDPVTDSWSRAADYPEPAAGMSCGTIDGLIYCAGGRDANHRPMNRAYVYHPASDSWHRIADLPLTAVGNGYAAANGLLLISGGVFGGYRTNMGFYYDPTTGDWGELPNSLFPVERMASACGFYKVGGYLNPAVGDVPWLEQLPGFDQCDTTGGDQLPWLSSSSTTGTLAPGESVEITVTFDATIPEVSQPGDYTGWLTVLEDTPFAVEPLRVTMAATPPPSWASITGTVTGLDRCDTVGPAAEGSPLAGAVVRIHDVRYQAEVRTDEAGRFTYWLDTYRQGNRPLPPLDVTASLDGWVADTGRVLVRPGSTATADFTLLRHEPCATADPAELSLTVPAGVTRPVHLTLGNTNGTAAYDYQLATAPHRLDPVPAGPTSLAAPEWTDGAAVPRGVRQYAHAQCPTDPDHGYVFGGLDPGFPEATFESWRYDAVADEWEHLPDVPGPVVNGVAVCEAGKIHVLGGADTDAVPSDRHYVYDIARNEWSEAAPLPTARAEAAAAVWNGTIYLAGGTITGDWYEVTDRVDAYDIATDTWRPAASMPVALRSPGFIQVGPELYLAGGLDRRTTEQVFDVVQVLDLDTGSWRLGPPLAEPRSHVAMAATDAAIYAIGGNRQDQFGLMQTATVQRLPHGGTAWELGTVPDLPVLRAYGAAGFCSHGRAGGEIWSIGGTHGLERTLYYPLAGERCATLNADVPWLGLPAPTGTVAAGKSTRITLTVDTTGLSAGDEVSATLLVLTSDPGAPELRVPVTVRVR
ncbi:MAG TPA: S8 family serine peptidase [Natronosporangium sp.]